MNHKKLKLFALKSQGKDALAEKVFLGLSLLGKSFLNFTFIMVKDRLKLMSSQDKKLKLNFYVRNSPIDFFILPVLAAESPYIVDVWSLCDQTL